MNQTTKKTSNSNLKIATVDLTLIALFASLGIATKNIAHPLVGPIIGSLDIPTGGVIGGLYMMWPVMAYGLIQKPGAATATSLVQAFIALLMPFGNFGPLNFPIYLAPGLAIDGFFLLTRHKACCAACCVGASAIANAVGTFFVGILSMRIFLVGISSLSLVALTFLVVVATISGGIGGFFANIILFRVGKLKFGGK